ncbi:MAG: hypothetical protein KatS3mg125_1075 [Lysobacterales bacterium]|jgi:hypothetical protein|nr:MAG: hypothetical protein KatS3mg125_1075 [Xanthomonadales bacterium]
MLWRWSPWIALLVSVALFAHNVVLLGGLARHPTLGPPAAAAAERESPWLSAQMQLGRWLAERGLFAESGLSAAREIFAAREQAVGENPEAALDLLLRPGLGFRHTLLRIGQWLAPLALLIAVLLFLFAPRTVHLVGGRRD